MHAVGEVNLESLAVFTLKHLVDFGRAEAVTGRVVFGNAGVDAGLKVANFEVGNLVFFVNGASVIDRGELINTRGGLT